MRTALIALIAAAAPAFAAVPVVTSFTGPATVVQGQAFQICWAASNTPASVTITPGLAGDNTIIYTDSTNPASGCATFTPPLARITADGDSLTCGFRAIGDNTAQNTTVANFILVHCNPNPNPNGAPMWAWPVRAIVSLRQSGYAIASYRNLGIVGITASGHTATTCTGSIYNPDILTVVFGANDLQNATLNSQADTFYTNIKSLWSSGVSSGCKVVAATITPRTNFTESVRVYANGLISGTPSLYSALIDIGNTNDVMSCSGCNVSATAYFNSDNTHYTNAGYQHMGDLAAAAIAPLMHATYSITATNVSGTSAVATLNVSVRENPPATSSSGVIR